MKILYLTSTRFPTTPWRDASTRYRCFHFAEDLRALGHHADVACLDDIGLSTLKDYTVVSFLRPTISSRLIDALATCAHHAITPIADFDDLVFSPEHADHAPAVVNGQTTSRHLQRRFEKHLQALKLFEFVTTATATLADQVRRLHPDATVETLTNGLSRYWLRANAQLDLQAQISQRQGSKFITYLPGTRSHTADFKCVESVLAQLLDTNDELKLRIVGDLEFDHSCFNPEQLELLPWMDYVLLPTVTATSLVTIAPLCSTDFNACKSHIKFIESAAFGTPVISSPNPDIERHLPQPGLSVARCDQEWKQAIDQSIDSQYYQSTCRALQDYANQTCLNQDVAEQFLTFLATQLDQRTHEHTVTLSAAS